MTDGLQIEASEPLLALLDRLHRSETVDQAFATAFAALRDGLAIDAGALLLPGREGNPEGKPEERKDDGQVHCRASCGLAPATQAALPAAAGLAQGDARISWQLGGSSATDPLGALAASEGMAGVAALPIARDGAAPGHLVVFCRAPRPPGDHGAALATLVAAQLGRALEIVRLRESERDLLRAAAESADRMRRLGRVAGALSSAPTARDVCTLVVTEAHEALGADWSGVWLLSSRGTQLEIIASRGGDGEVPKDRKMYPIGAENPLCLAVRTNESIWLETWQDFAQRFPASEARARHSPPVSFGCLPLRIDDEMIGGLVVTFFKQRVFPADERTFLNLFAQHCAQGIARARLYDQAMAAIRVRDDFLSVAGHELRTPLSTLLLQTQGLVDSPDELPARVRQRLAPVHRSLHRLIRLADDVLDVSRMRAGRLSLEPEPLELVSFVRDVATRTVEGWHRAKYELHFEARATIEGRWDPVRLEQIVVNLITNACKYGLGNPIHTGVHRTANGVEIVVRDGGIGVAEADQARIFERFERSVEDRNFSGLGLGLWIARELTALHGGTISVKSEAGHGAEFTVRLPLTSASVRRTSS
jgi:signal transduction histidine kinase